MEYRDRISQDPEVCGGRPVFKGTRVPVDTVLEYIARGLTDVAILEAYPTLTAVDIRAAIILAAATAKGRLQRLRARRPRIFGGAKGAVEIPDSFYEELPSDILDAFEGKST